MYVQYWNWARRIRGHPRFGISLDDNDGLGEYDGDNNRPLGWLDLVAFLDVINVFGGVGANPPEFNPRNGMNVPDEEEALPIIGLILEKNW